MASCSFCNSTILFGGVVRGGQRFCNAECEQKQAVTDVGTQIPRHELERQAWQVFRGNCPRCNGSGPVDVHTSYRVWSALFLTTWSSQPAICCRRCGVRNKLKGSLFSVVLGWWGFPWGLIFTPIQIVRNLAGLVPRQEPTAPSPELEKMLLHVLALESLRQTQAPAHQ